MHITDMKVIFRNGKDIILTRIDVSNRIRYYQARQQGCQIRHRKYITRKKATDMMRLAGVNSNGNLS